MAFPLFAAALPVVGALGVIAWRLKETQRPLTERRIIIPPLGMSTGFSMFLYPPMRVPALWGLGAFLAGAALLAPALIATSKMSIEGDQIFLKRSKAFLWVVVILLAVRHALRVELGLFISHPQTASLFYLLAFGMIVCWRGNMLGKYRSLRVQMATASHGGSPIAEEV